MRWARRRSSCAIAFRSTVGESCSRIDDDFHPSYPLGVVSLSDVLSMLNQMILNLSALQRRGDGEHDARPRLAISRPGPPHRTVAGHDRAAAEHAVRPRRRTSTRCSRPLLEIADSSMTYRNRYATNLQVGPLLDLLLTDETNPRSIAFQLVGAGPPRRALAAATIRSAAQRASSG